MTRLAICASILAACGNGDSVPGPVCGDGEIESGEECDDGNEARGDGCFECVVEPPVCGNGVLDFNEACDDSNTVDGDGCSAICEQEIPERRITATWTFKDLQGDLTTACPAGATNVEVDVQPAAGETITETFACSAGTGTTGLIAPGSYRVLIRVLDASGVIAFALPQTVDLAFGDGVYDTTIYNDAGYFSFDWTLRGALSLMVLTCAQSGVTNVAARITGPTNVVDTRPCGDATAITSPLLAGTTYSVAFDALNANLQVVGTSAGFTNLTIGAPNDVTVIGALEIPINNQ